MNITREIMNNFAAALESGRMSEEEKDLLGQSLFYYCSGIDPSPIAALGATVPLYVYVDSFVYIKDGFSATSKELYSRLEKHKFKNKATVTPKLKGRLKNASNAELSLWIADNGEAFLLLFVQADAIDGYEAIYGSSEMNYLQPKYVCNYRYELRERGVISQLEKRVQYILGHCFDPKYRQVGEIPHLDRPDEKIGIYHRFYYYLF